MRELVAERLRARNRLRWAEEVAVFVRGTPVEWEANELCAWLRAQYAKACEVAEKAEAAAAKAELEALVAKGE